MAGSFGHILNTLQPVYTTQQNDVVNEFYIPVLSSAVSYDRVTGFFSSSALSIAARGLSKFLSNPASKMRLIVSCKGFEKGDEIENVYNVEEELLFEFDRILKDDIDALEDAIVKKRVAALAWLLKIGRLEIKVAKMTRLQYERGMLHSKFGILCDEEENKICFSGSINESQTGWKINGEAISVYKSSVSGQLEYINRYVREFNDYWNNQVEGVVVLDLPDAIKTKLIGYSCSSVDDVIPYIDPETGTSSKKLWYYQEEAIDGWLKNNMCGFFEMATGTGKTLTAIHCMKKAAEKHRGLSIIVAVPTNTLVMQWKKDMIGEGFREFDIQCCSSDYPNWETSFRRRSMLKTSRTYVFIFTYQSLSTEAVQEIVNNAETRFMIVCDEMHHAGAPKFSKCLNKKIEYRLGLSATPIRSHDIEGNQILMDYFGDEPLLVFGIDRALREIDPSTGKTYLCPYEYHFETVELSPVEHKEYRKLSKQIAIQHGTLNEDDRYQPDKLRALLISCASGKIDILDELIKMIKREGSNKKMLFYCQSFKSKDTGEKQIDSVRKIIRKNNLNSLDFTSKFDDIEVRKSILNALRNDTVDAIIAIKCLDEGVNLPEVRTAVILASSSNSAEFIQRRGRILRNSTSTGKDHAELYDFLVGPPYGTELKESDKSLIKREFRRAMEYATHCTNSTDAKEKVFKWLEGYKLSEKDMSDDKVI